ncbi:phosphatidylserine decarboxylase [Powellomyces hirtus]|uniref:phosphatidylserine decarboxylase n=1 Tax=Powellomyces hirtus TaxID=109895 RepID=A0A507EES5_9FUNG|nr:phosphatidylserine decarboxylase [Powellomyces hirtus]
MDHVKEKFQSLQAKLTSSADTDIPPTPDTPSEAIPSNSQVVQQHEHRLHSWADHYTGMIDTTTLNGPQTAGGVHDPVAHDSAPHTHLLWFYGHHTPHSDDPEQAAKHFHFKVYNRRTGTVEKEKVPLATKLGMEFLFEDMRSVDATAFIKKRLEKETIRMGRAYNEPESAKHIPGFVTAFNLPLDILVEPDIEQYRTFNEFFARKMKPECRPIAHSGDEAIVSSAADCRLSVFPTIDLAKQYWIKGHNFTLENLFQDSSLAQTFSGGSLGIFRLAPQDYHRWHSPVSGVLNPIKKIPGTYYTVNPKAVRENLDVYTENTRHVSVLSSPVFGKIGIVAVGAMLVGSIVITADEGTRLERGQEMGYFEFGGSTVIVLFEKGRMMWDEDLVSRSQLGMETLVLLGDKIGQRVETESVSR